MALKPRSGFSRQNFLAKTLAAPFRRLGRFPFPITREARSFIPSERPFCVATMRKTLQKFSRDPAIMMAIIIELVEVAENLVKVKTTQIADEDDNADWELVQQVEDERSANEFERLEVRDTIRVLLERTNLSLRERQVVNLLLQGYNFNEIARKLKVSRSFVGYTLKRAVQKLRKTASKLGIVP
jgi:RNA polymerase sigma factor (sigma-70 family)